MIITCPECSAKFTVETRLIPTGGRKLRCSKCAHVWHFVPDESAADPVARFEQTFEELRRSHEDPPASVQDPIPESISPNRGGRKKSAPPKKPESPKSLKARMRSHWVDVRTWWRTLPAMEKASAMVGISMGLVFFYTVSILSASHLVAWRSALSPVFHAFGIVHHLPDAGLTLTDIRLQPVQTADGRQTLQIVGSVRNDGNILRELPDVQALIETKLGRGDSFVGRVAKEQLKPGEESEFLISANGWPPAGARVAVRFYMP